MSHIVPHTVGTKLLILFTGSAVRITSVTDGDHVDQTLSIVNLINHSVVTNPDAPEVTLTDQFPAARRPGVDRQGFDPLEYARNERASECLELFTSRLRKGHRI